VTAAIVPANTFAGLKVTPLDLGGFLSQVDRCVTGGSRLTVTYLNPDYARRALRSVRLRSHINAFDIVLVDGNGVRALTPLYGFTVKARLDTDRVAPAVWGHLAPRRGRVFLFGCAPGVAERASHRLRQDFPGLEVVGTEHGFHDVQRGHPGRFSEEDNVRILDRIESARPDVLLVSLPTPLQQEWVFEHASALSVPVIMTAGSYLDHVADQPAVGSWYPAWVDRFQLNWLYRLAHEPRRLWRRYTIEMVEYAALVTARRIHG
jgi:N-acetylglucosaminyldiphosphoundecaprenol N-acetyl-beta-D-mannosaminyltransferase